MNRIFFLGADLGVFRFVTNFVYDLGIPSLGYLEIRDCGLTGMADD